MFAPRLILDGNLSINFFIMIVDLIYLDKLYN